MRTTRFHELLLEADRPIAAEVHGKGCPDRRRFAYRWACQLWMSDVMHGPAVTDGVCYVVPLRVTARG